MSPSRPLSIVESRDLTARSMFHSLAESSCCLSQAETPPPIVYLYDLSLSSAPDGLSRQHACLVPYSWFMFGG